MRVLIYSASYLPKVDGVSKRLQSQLKTLVRYEECEFLLLCPDFSTNEMPSLLEQYRQPKEFNEGVPIIRIPSFSPVQILAPDTRLANPFLFFQLEELFLHYRPDVVHFMGPDFLWLTMLWVRTRVPFKTLVSYHQHNAAWLALQPLPYFFKWILKGVFLLDRLLNQAEYILAPSLYMKQYLLEERNIHCEGVWPKAVDLELFKPIHLQEVDKVDWRHEWTFGDLKKDQVILLLYVGRLEYEKSIHWLVEVIKQLPDAYLVIIGGGLLSPLLSKLHGKQNRIWFSNAFWSQEELAKAYGLCDIFVFPSSFETFGNVCLEAMACGSFVVTRRRGGLTDIVKDEGSEEDNGLLIDSDNVSEMVAKVKLVADSRKEWLSSMPEMNKFEQMEVLLNQPVVISFIQSKSENLYAKRIQTAYHQIHQGQFTWEKAGEFLMECYKQLLQ